jgi:GT2 family glycosyltransferase
MNLAVPADLFRSVGGFNQKYRTSEDREFCARWLGSGMGLVYARDAVVVHRPEGGLSRFWRRHYHFGKGAFQFRSGHTKDSRGHIRMEPSAFYRRLLSAPFAEGFSVRAAGQSLLVLLSQIASAAGFLSARFAHHISNGRSE